MQTNKQLKRSIAIIIALSICLCVTSFALIYSMVSVNENLFQTGHVSINLNDGEAVIKEHEFLFEPGMTVKKTFFIENESSCEVYYKIYFQNVLGGLSDLLEVTIKEEERVLYEGTPKELEREKVEAAEDTLKVNERRELDIYFHFPEEIGNQGQGLTLSFDLAADAVQTKNNELKEFE